MQRSFAKTALTRRKREKACGLAGFGSLKLYVAWARNTAHVPLLVNSSRTLLGRPIGGSCTPPPPPDAPPGAPSCRVSQVTSDLMSGDCSKLACLPEPLRTTKLLGT